MSAHTPDQYDVVIAGGGLAGCSAAIELAQAGRSVLVLERDRMPRDKLCGEFLSTEVSALCSRLRLLDRLTRGRAREIRRVVATSPRSPVFEAPLQGSATGVSRHTLDAAFFERAGEAGAEMRADSAAETISGSLESGFTVTFDGGSARGRVVLGAYGRRDMLDRRLSRAFLKDRSPYVAFKAHFVGLDLADRIELHSFPGGYCGLLTEDHEVVNACWISHHWALKAAGGTPDSMIESSFGANQHLADRFDHLHRINDYHSASQLFFHKKTLFEGDICMIGDAAGMIAPLCGDGMAMAIQSGTLAAECIDPLLEGRMDAAAFKAAYSREWNARFAGRMRLGRLLHAAYVRPAVSKIGLHIARLLPSVAGAVIRATRG